MTDFDLGDLDSPFDTTKVNHSMTERTFRVPNTRLGTSLDARDSNKNKGILPTLESHFGRIEDQSDHELIRACLDGDQSAWKELVNRYARLVYSIPRRYSLSSTDADDVMQNVFTIVFRRLGSLRDKERLSAWLITIAHRESMRVSKQTVDDAEMDDAAYDDDDPPLERIQKWERLNFIHRGLDRMGSPCRDLLVALFFESDSADYHRVAERFGMAIGAVGPTRARCFKKLEAILLALGFDW